VPKTDLAHLCTRVLEGSRFLKVCVMHPPTPVRGKGGTIRVSRESGIFPIQFPGNMVQIVSEDIFTVL
jgi:hypothetical protein